MSPKLGLIARWLQVQHVDVERLLVNWRWLCPSAKKLVARSAFGDLFLCDESGQVQQLDVSRGKLRKVADSEIQFQHLLETPQNRDEWFGEKNEQGFSEKG